jgi:hypothetical protein
LGVVTLRAAPILEHAVLPGGGSVTVWVGVPDDPYIDDKRELHNVDLQLHEGNSVVATITTVLEPEQTSEAEQLAREVKAAIESGEIGLHASELERFADQLR